MKCSVSPLSLVTESEDTYQKGPERSCPSQCLRHNFFEAPPSKLDEMYWEVGVWHSVECQKYSKPWNNPGISLLLKVFRANIEAIILKQRYIMKYKINWWFVSTLFLFLPHDLQRSEVGIYLGLSHVTCFGQQSWGRSDSDFLLTQASTRHHASLITPLVIHHENMFQVVTSPKGMRRPGEPTWTQPKAWSHAKQTWRTTSKTSTYLLFCPLRFWFWLLHGKRWLTQKLIPRSRVLATEITAALAMRSADQEIRKSL